ncbi:hypothetical protein RB195_008466 [Necator americanus]|uniref:Uncharacterized protein n=1 Tax=Necator americanus TaxID=51031 RepID=A0ABR1CQ19_NECAM
MPVITNEVKLRVYLSKVRPIMMYGSETWAAPSAVIERLDYMERKVLEDQENRLRLSCHVLRKRLLLYGLGILLDSS